MQGGFYGQNAPGMVNPGGFTNYQGVIPNNLGVVVGNGQYTPGFNFGQQPTYVIRSQLNGRCLDVSQTNDWGNQQGDLIIYDYVGGLNQQWHIIRDGPDFILRSAQSGRVLDSCFQGNKQLNLNPTSLGNNLTQLFNTERVRINDFNGSFTQKWRIQEVAAGSGQYFIYCSGTGKALDVQGESGANNTPIIPYDFHGRDNQIWLIQPL
jgi:hypothetical protein